MIINLTLRSARVCSSYCKRQVYLRRAVFSFIMGFENSIKIGVSLVITVAFLSFTLFYTKKFSDEVADTTSKALTIAANVKNDTISQMLVSLQSGDNALKCIDEYSQTTPILLVTGELSKTSPGYSYDVTKCRNTRAAEYINSGLKYSISADFDDAGSVLWIRIVQSDILDADHLPTVESTLSDYERIRAKLELKNELISKQYQLYYKDTH